MDIQTLIIGLAPAFMVGFAIQQLLELADPIVERISVKNKKIIHGVLSITIGILFALGTGLRILKTLAMPCPNSIDLIITALIISAGTEGFNSILKFLEYTKTKAKA